MQTIVVTLALTLCGMTGHLKASNGRVISIWFQFLFEIILIVEQVARMTQQSQINPHCPWAKVLNRLQGAELRELGSDPGGEGSTHSSAGWLWACQLTSLSPIFLVGEIRMNNAWPMVLFWGSSEHRTWKNFVDYKTLYKGQEGWSEQQRFWLCRYRLRENEVQDLSQNARNATFPFPLLLIK